MFDPIRLPLQCSKLRGVNLAGGRAASIVTIDQQAQLQSVGSA
jgi:hypothetical protein